MSCKGQPAPRASQRGVALAILVWFVAAMSLLVAGVMMQARVDIKLAQHHAAKARAEAMADGAITLTMAQISMLENRGEFLARNQHLFPQALGGQTVFVSVTPLAGLIDLNQAPEELLAQLFIGAGNIDENVARELATSVVEWRTPRGGVEEESEGMRHAQFEATEDLLHVPGIDRDLYDAVRDSTYVSRQSRPTIDWLSAPVSVLQSLGMSEDEAMEYSRQRIGDDAVSLASPEAIDPTFMGTDSLPGFRIDAVVTLDDASFLRRRWVDRSRTGPDGLPWHFFRTEPMRGVQRVNPDALAGLVVQEAFDAGL